MTVKVRVKRRHIKDLPAITGKPLKVKVGFPRGETDSDVIDRAIYTHFGTRHIPSRPFLKITMSQKKGKYRDLMGKGAKKILTGDLDPRTVMMMLGEEAKGDVQDTITTLRDPPNAASTIKKKGSSNPLIDSGEMRRSVTYKVDD